MLKKLIRLVKDNKVFEPLLFLFDAFLRVTDVLACIGIKRGNNGAIGLIKLDKIGDYILFRNYAKAIRDSKKFGNFKLVLIANSEYRAFEEYLDPGLYDEVIWLNIYAYSTNFLYRFKFSRIIRKAKIQVIIASTFARVLVLDDFIARLSGAKQIYGQKAHPINIKSWERKIGDRYYTDLIDLSRFKIFEFERNRLFFENCLNESLKHIDLQIQIPNSEDPLPGPYIIFLPGAAVPYRQWDAEYFAQLADLICEETNYNIILCGASGERYCGEAICSKIKFRDRVINQIGQLSIDSFFKLLSQSLYIVSNETGAVHIAAAMNKQVFCISNGNHFGRFTEYPEAMHKKVEYIYPKEIQRQEFTSEMRSSLHSKYEISSGLDIQTISVNDVLVRIHNLFQIN